MWWWWKRRGGNVPYWQKVLRIGGVDVMAYYPLWETSGQVAYDISGNERHAYIYGCTLNQAGIGDGRPSMLFDGINDYIAGLGILAGTNLITNPVFGVNTAGWGNSGFATFERSTTVARFGTASLRLYDAAVATADLIASDFMPTTAGVTYSASAWFKKTIATGSGRFFINWYTAGPAYISSNTINLTAGVHDWQMYSLSAAAPGTATQARLLFDGTGLTAGTPFEAYIDGVNFTATALPLWHIDGTQPGCSWTGAAHASTSVRTEAFSGAAGTLAAWVKYPAGVWTDGVQRHVANLVATDASNKIRLTYRTATNNQLYSIYHAGGTAEDQGDTAYGGITNWLHTAITWDKAADQVKYYVNGAQWGATDTALGIWVGALDPALTLIGAYTSAVLFHSGNLAHVILLDRAATAGEVAQMASA